MKNAVAALAVAIIGLVTALVSGLALVPRVRLVEVLTLIATAIGSGAALAVAVVQLRQAMSGGRAERSDRPTR